MTLPKIETVIQILEALGEGENPATGEKLPESSVANHPQSIRVLLKLAKELQPNKYEKYVKRTPEQVKIDNTRQGRPINSHQPWTEVDHRKLIEMYKTGVGVAEIANKLKRSPLAIAGRLFRSGLMTAQQVENYSKA